MPSKASMSEDKRPDQISFRSRPLKRIVPSILVVWVLTTVAGLAWGHDPQAPAARNLSTVNNFETPFLRKFVSHLLSRKKGLDMP